MSRYILLRDLMQDGRSGHGEDRFNLRVYAPEGRMTTEQLSRLLQILRKCGTEQVLFTPRQGIEVPYVAFDRIEEVVADLADIGLDSMYISCVPEKRE